MLALSRKKNEAIMINNDIEITVLDIRNEQVKIGIAAPKQIPVYRKEVYLQIQEENKKALEGGNLEGLDKLLSDWTFPITRRPASGLSFCSELFG